MRKPKEHYGISTRGINFRERWNIVKMATEEEFKEYIRLEKRCRGIRIKDSSVRWNSSGQAQRENLKGQQRYIRKCWRLRYGNTFKKDQLYKIDRTIHRYNCKVSPRGSNGSMGIWTLRRLEGGNKLQGLGIGTIVLYSHTDEIGMHYFTRADQIDSPHQYVFKSDDSQLCAIVPLEET